MERKVDLYCKCCKKSLKISCELSNVEKDTAMPELIIKCHTRKCVKMINLKKYTENKLRAMMTQDGKVYV